MEGTGLQCNGCGSSNVVFDPQTRILVCKQCGKEEYYSRATLNRNGKVLFAKENAMRFFTEAKYEDAHHYAHETLDISRDNAPALFILSYYDEFVAGRLGTMKRFFVDIGPIALEYDEVRDLIKMFEAAVYRLTDYEKEMIELMAKNMQAKEDIPDFSAFIDKISSYIIPKRTSSVFLSSEMVEIYAEIAGRCDIPKTCLALLKSIELNPDSPYKTNSFYMRSKTQYFYDNYVLAIGRILAAMKESDYRSKFLSAFNKMKASYEERMKQ
ncbi:MAG: hypothetical protein K6E85_01700 [Lachnospiraceae bacterium]|nr:hypothetical protein [Lachnospiraceae bacterium]